MYGGRESSTRCNFRKHMQTEKTPANQENIFISLTAGGANAHNTTKYILFAVRFFVWLCCEHLHHLLSNWWRCFLDLLVLVKLTKVIFLICWRFFSTCTAFLFWLCCGHLQRVRCKIEEVVFLICRCFFYLQRVELSRPPYKWSTLCCNFNINAFNHRNPIQFPINYTKTNKKMHY